MVLIDLKRNLVSLVISSIIKKLLSFRAESRKDKPLLLYTIENTQAEKREIVFHGVVSIKKPEIRR
jgi:hypothetical protein